MMIAGRAIRPLVKYLPLERACGARLLLISQVGITDQVKSGIDTDAWQCPSLNVLRKADPWRRDDEILNGQSDVRSSANQSLSAKALSGARALRKSFGKPVAPRERAARCFIAVDAQRATCPSSARTPNGQVDPRRWSDAVMGNTDAFAAKLDKNGSFLQQVGDAAGQTAVVAVDMPGAGLHSASP
jgi:hypothetical protein